MTSTDSSISKEVPKETVDEIVRRFAKEVPPIFGDNLVFGFVCGSVARGVTVYDDDIDTLIVLKKIDHDQIHRFRTWIFDLHDTFGMKIDKDFPYELFTLETLEEKFSALDRIRPSLHYVSSPTYDTMTWAEMVYNPSKAGIIGDQDLIKSQADRCNEHVQRWRKEIVGDLKREGTRAFTASRYLGEVNSNKRDGGLEGGDAIFFADRSYDDLTHFDWVDDPFFGLARLMRRFLPLPDTAPPVPMSDVEEAFLDLPILMAGEYRMRALKPRDLQDLFEMCRNPNVARYCSWDPMTLEQVEDFVVAQIKRAGRGECNPWAICKDDQLIGTCSILSVDKELKSCDIGFALKESEWNNKIATTAANRMIEFIDHELGMHEVVADCEVEDLATARVLEKLGMKRVVVMEKEVEREGSMRDLALYKLALK